MNGFFKQGSVLSAALVLALGAGSLDAEERHKREVYGEGQIFQNIAAEHVVPLLRNTAWVSHWETGEGQFPRGGKVAIVWYGSDGIEYKCFQGNEPNENGTWIDGDRYFGVTIELRRRAVRYPLLKATYVSGKPDGYGLLRYNGETGALTSFIMDRRWWESGVGHLQERIPAVTWELCPTFPSAESLGTTVNEAQTSRFYGELLQQDPGRRILRPELVNEHAHEWLTDE